MMSDRRKRDKEQTVRDVMTAATQLFSENGLHGTSLRDIENASGVSKGLIIHHFGSKNDLYAAVQDRLNQAYISWMADQRDASKDLLESMKNAIRGSLSYLKQNTEYRRIVLWSQLEGMHRATDLDKRFTANLIEAMRVGQENSLVRDDVEAFILPFIIRGAIDYWIRGESLRNKLIKEGQSSDDISDDDFVEVLVKLMLK